MKDRTARESVPNASRQTETRPRRRIASGFELEPMQLRAALAASDQPLLIADAFDRVCFVNQAAARLLGRPVESIQQADLRDFFTASGKPTENAPHGVLLRAEHGAQSLDWMLGDGRRVRAALTPLQDSFGQATHVCLGLEAAARASAASTLDLLGRLTGEIVHDVNNQLSAALNYVFILQRRLGHDETLASHLDGLQAAAWRAAALTSGLRLIGRKRSSAPQRLRLDETLERLEPFLQHVADGIRLELRLDPGVPEVYAPQAQLEQVITMVTLYALARSPIGSTLRLVASTIGAGVPRLCWEVVTDVAITPEPRADTHHANGMLRRAIKRTGARLGHDGSRLWVDFPQPSTHAGLRLRGEPEHTLAT